MSNIHLKIYVYLLYWKINKRDGITVTWKYAYADDLELMRADRHGQAVEGVPSNVMATVSEYLQTGT